MGMFNLDFTRKYISKKDLKPEKRREHWTPETPKWMKAGYDEDGKLIQYNLKTKKYRILDKWVEIFRTSNESK